jgi:hypothetical protein
MKGGDSISADKIGQFDYDVAVRMIGKIIGFLRNVMTEIQAERIVSIVFIVAGIPNDQVAELTGLCESGSLPAKADSQKRRWSYHTILKLLMDRAKKGEISLLYLDALHFLMGCDIMGESGGS